jgi:hypothetical protein
VAEVGETPPGDPPPGDHRSWVVGATELTDMYELERDRELNGFWSVPERRGVGEPRDERSLLRMTKSVFPCKPNGTVSFGGGLAARRFWPIEAYPSDSWSLFRSDVSSMSISSAYP